MKFIQQLIKQDNKIYSIYHKTMFTIYNKYKFISCFKIKNYNYYSDI